MPHSPMNLQTDTVHRHFTESGGNAHSPMNLQTERVRRHFIVSGGNAHSPTTLSVSILPRAKKYLLDMPLSPTE
jgi:hypothetical protein